MFKMRKKVQSPNTRASQNYSSSNAKPAEFIQRNNNKPRIRILKSFYPLLHYFILIPFSSSKRFLEVCASVNHRSELTRVSLSARLTVSPAMTSRIYPLLMTSRQRITPQGYQPDVTFINLNLFILLVLVLSGSNRNHV